MALPRVETTILTKQVKLPISGKTIKVRAFLAKEEKLLLMVKDSKSASEIAEIICQVMDACCFGEIDSRKLASADLETLFLAIRCLSKGETSDVTYICRNNVPDENDPKKMVKCNTPVQIEIKLDDVKVKIAENHNSVVKIEGTPFSVHFRYPTMKDSMMVMDVPEDKLKESDVFDSIMSLVTSISNDETGVIYEDFTKEELTEFFDQLPFGFLGDITQTFFGTIPTLEKEVEFKCPSCGHTEQIKIKGLINFF